MGLKDDILKAFENNLTHDKVNQEGEIYEIKPPTGKNTPLDILATELRDAFLTFLVFFSSSKRSDENPGRIPLLGDSTESQTSTPTRSSISET